jgi:hypothetical protein
MSPIVVHVHAARTRDVKEIDQDGRSEGRLGSHSAYHMERRGRITDTQTPRMVAPMRFDCLNLLDQTLLLPATLLVHRGLALSLFTLGR